MARSSDFAVVKVSPDPLRDEAMNAMVIILRPDGLQVMVTPNPERLRGLAPAVGPATLDELATSLKVLDAPGETTAKRIARLRRLPGIIISEPGELYGETDQDVDSRATELASRLLSSVRAPATVVAPRVTGVTRELINIFRKEKLLGRGPEDLGKHKIVRDFPVSSDGALRADFVAKNKSTHVTETVDLRTSGHHLTAARMKDIAVAALTLDESKRHFGKQTTRYFIYVASASAERQASGFLHAAEHHAEHTFNFASKMDRGHYLDFMYSTLRGDLAGTAAKPNRSKRRRMTHRSEALSHRR
jgi:Protein of unknown function (DUF3037)